MRVFVRACIRALCVRCACVRAHLDGSVRHGWPAPDPERARARDLGPRCAGDLDRSNSRRIAAWYKLLKQLYVQHARGPRRRSVAGVSLTICRCTVPLYMYRYEYAASDCRILL